MIGPIRFEVASIWQLLPDPLPPLKLELLGSHAMSPAATTTGSLADVGDRVGDGVTVGVLVGVFVAVGVLVTVAVLVAVGTGVGVAVFVAVRVAVPVGVFVAVGVLVGVSVVVAVRVGVSLDVGVGVGSSSPKSACALAPPASGTVTMSGVVETAPGGFVSLTV